jgi:hypothetical protein
MRIGIAQIMPVAHIKRISRLKSRQFIFPDMLHMHLAYVGYL